MKENTEIELFEINIFSLLKEDIIKALLKLGIDPNGKTIRYNRKNNGTSYLLIKLNDEDENELKNYVSFGAEVISFKDFNAVDIYVHADKKLYKNANEFIGLLHPRVKEFFETFEDYLSKNNMQNKDLEIAMPIEFDKNKKENIFSRIRKYIKNRS
mgnify:FL=1